MIRGRKSGATEKTGNLPRHNGRRRVSVNAVSRGPQQRTCQYWGLVGAGGRESIGSLCCLFTGVFSRTPVANRRSLIRTDVGVDWLRNQTGRRLKTQLSSGAAASGTRTLPGPLSYLSLCPQISFLLWDQQSQCPHHTFQGLFWLPSDQLPSQRRGHSPHITFLHPCTHPG